MTQPLAPKTPFIHTLFGCREDPKQCVDTFFCYYCQNGRQCSAIDGHKNMANCGMCCATCCFPYIVPACIRSKVVKKYEIDETCLHIVLLGVFCGGCSTCQMGRELNSRGVNPGGTIMAPDDAAPMGGGGGAGGHQPHQGGGGGGQQPQAHHGGGGGGHPQQQGGLDDGLL